MIAAQFDVLPGFDLSSVTSPTRTQHIQTVSQIAPLSNIGGIIFGAGASKASSILQGVNSPSVTNNPRFARYMWLNSFNIVAEAPTPYFYDPATGTWVITAVAPGSIVNASIASNAEIAVSKLGDGGANEIIRTDAAGTGVEWVSVATLLAALNDSVPLTAIDDTAAVGAESFLRRVGSTTSWKTFAETVTAIQAALSGVAPSIFTPGANNTLLGTNGSGVVAFNTPANILANGSLPTQLLSTTGGVSNDLIRFDGSNWVRVTPNLVTVNPSHLNDNLGGLVAATGGTLAAAASTYNHNLTTRPYFIRVTGEPTAGVVAGYTPLTDRVDISGFFDAAGPCATVSATTTVITISQRITASISVVNKAGGGSTVITPADWQWRVYAIGGSV